MRITLAYFGLACLFFNAPVLADEVSKSIEIQHAWIKPSPPSISQGQDSAIIYVMRIYNTSDRPDKLIKIECPMASRTELHAHSTNTQGITSISKLPSIPIPARGSIGLMPEGQKGLQGFHGMLIGLNRQLTNKDVIFVIFRFESGHVTLNVPVKTD